MMIKQIKCAIILYLDKKKKNFGHLKHQVGCPRAHAHTILNLIYKFWIAKCCTIKSKSTDHIMKEAKLYCWVTSACSQLFVYTVGMLSVLTYTFFFFFFWIYVLTLCVCVIVRLQEREWENLRHWAMRGSTLIWYIDFCLVSAV